MSVRAVEDNVWLKLDDKRSVSKGGIELVDSTKVNGCRFGTVTKSGPGWRLPNGTFVENETKPGCRVIVSEHAGQDYGLEFTVPRHNKATEFDRLGDDRGEFRVVREEEIAGLLDGNSIIPLRDNIVIRRTKADEITKGGIIIPDTAKQPALEGTVEAVGPGKVYGNGKRYAPDVCVGNRVLFGKFQGTDVTVNGEEFLVINWNNIMGVVDDAQEAEIAA